MSKNQIAQVTDLIIYPVKWLGGISQPTVGVSGNWNIMGDRVATLLYSAQADENSIFRWPKHGEKLPEWISPSNFQVTSDPCSATNRWFFLHYWWQRKHIGISSSQKWIVVRPFWPDWFQLVYDQNGNPDDHDAHGPTVVSEESITEVGEWLWLSRAEIIARFRPNIIVSQEGGKPFWEERELLWPLGTPFRFQVGEIMLDGTNVCIRCRIPTLNPATWEVSRRDFMQTFMRKKESHITDDDSRKGQMRKNHPKSGQPFTYRFALNTRSVWDETEGIVRVGDSVFID